MSEKKGFWKTLFGGSGSGCCNMEITEEPKKGGCCDMEIVEEDGEKKDDDEDAPIQVTDGDGFMMRNVELAHVEFLQASDGTPGGIYCGSDQE